jgi:hypothetical protein
MSDAPDEAEERWAAAAKLADGVMDEGLRKRRRRTFTWVVALIVGSWVIGFVLAFLVLPHGNAARTGSEPSDQQVIGQFIFLGLGLLVGITGFVWARRTGHYITRWRAVASPLNRKEKKSVRRQIAGRTEIDRRRLPTILAIAKQNRMATLGVAPIWSALVLFAIATAIASNDLVIKLLELVAALLFVVVAVQLTFVYRKAGRFIESNSKSTTGETTDS